MCHILSVSLMSFLNYGCPLFPFACYLLKKHPDYGFYGLSLYVSFNMFLCYLYFLGIIVRSEFLISFMINCMGRIVH